VTTFEQTGGEVGKICLGWQKARQFCIKTTSQIIGAAAAAPAAPLSTPMVMVILKFHPLF